jgi:hypothetical protein
VISIAAFGTISFGWFIYPEPRGPRVLPVGELVLWYGMFALVERLLGTTGFARGAPYGLLKECLDRLEDIALW